MAVEMISVKCPQCGATLNISSDMKRAFCTYCGGQLLLNNTNEYIYRHVDEAEVVRAEAQKQYQIKQLEMEEKENESNKLKSKIALFCGIGMVLLGLLIKFVLKSDNSSLGLFLILFGIMALFLSFVISDTSPSKRQIQMRQAAALPDEVVISDEIFSCYNIDYNISVAQIRSLGFNNVKAMPMNDLNFLQRKENGKVASITINGSKDYSVGDVVKKSAEVIIAYHNIR